VSFGLIQSGFNGSLRMPLGGNILRLMRIYLPDQNLLAQTSSVDYYQWNYKFPLRYVQRYRFKAILDLLGTGIYDRILEIGTGSGIFLPELARHCEQLYACDIHDKMDAVRELCRLTSIKANLVRCSITQTGFDDDAFDVIIGVSMLEFIDDLETAFAEIQRILKKQGVFLIICPQQNPVTDAVLRLFSRRDPDEEFKQSRKKVYLMLEKHFKVNTKISFPKLFGKILPIYCSYKLSVAG